MYSRTKRMVSSRVLLRPEIGLAKIVLGLILQIFKFVPDDLSSMIFVRILNELLGRYLEDFV